MVPDHAHPARGLIVRDVTLRDFRSYAGLEARLEPGLVLVTGPNGAGKTNLLEALHVGTQGFSPRTRADRRLIRFGAEAGRILLRGVREERPFESDVVLAAAGRRVSLNGAALPSSEALRHEFRTLVFTPDRLAIVKGGPAVRRAYLDRCVERILPARAAAPAEYGAALGQRNAALRRIANGSAALDALAPWTEAVAARAAALVDARLETVVALEPAFAAVSAELGLTSATLAYSGAAPDLEDYAVRLDTDLERGATGIGPHLHDVQLSASGRDLRSFGSQGEQRAAVLALVLAEAHVLAERTGSRPLLLLDDVLSELDLDRRRSLARLLERDGQAVLTATSRDLLPATPAQSLAIVDGTLEAA